MEDDTKMENYAYRLIFKEEERGTALAKQHVNWFLDTLRPLLIDHFVHGYKHGIDEAKSATDEETQ